MAYGGAWGVKAEVSAKSNDFAICLTEVQTTANNTTTIGLNKAESSWYAKCIQGNPREREENIQGRFFMTTFFVHCRFFSATIHDRIVREILTHDSKSLARETKIAELCNLQ